MPEVVQAARIANNAVAAISLDAMMPFLVFIHATLMWLTALR
jgi:hypothetical protein